MRFDAVVQCKGASDGALVTSGNVQIFGYFTGSPPDQQRSPRSAGPAPSPVGRRAARAGRWQQGSSRDPAGILAPAAPGGPGFARDVSSDTVTVTHGSDLSFSSLPVVSCYYLCLKRN